MNRAVALAILATTMALCSVDVAEAQPPQAASQPRWHGEYFPNIVLQDQDGRSVRFYDDLIRDKVVAINFIFTACTDVCPLDTAQLRAVQKQLGDRVGRDIFMYSVSINEDTPEALRHFMQMYDVGPGWRFLTGSKEDVTKLQRLLGLRVDDPDDLRNHSASIVLGNETTAQWIKRSAYENPKNLAELLTVYLQNSAPTVSRRSLSYAAAGEVSDNSRGAYLFRTRCQSCHSIGEGDGLGPDLTGVVASRPAAWLSRWISEPDKMIAERDATAIAIMARYRDLPMPNLGLGEDETNDVIAFIRAAEARHSEHAGHQTGHAEHAGHSGHDGH
jgi:cytochrome oxidase Cu insertion factor (SCO1/SenC/PrrC family)